MIDIKKWKTEKIENLVKQAIEKMPENATNVRLIEGYRHKVGYFGTHHHWTEVEAVYKDDEGHEVKRIRTLDKLGGWQYSDPANYVLYTMGLYVPFSEDNLTSIKGRYEQDLDWGSIYPINEVYSDTYNLDLECKEAIFSTTDVKLTFVLDYDYAEDVLNGKMNPSLCYVTNVKRGSFQIVMEYNGKKYCTEHKGEYGAYKIFNQVYDTLSDNGVNVDVSYDMSADDKEYFLGHYVWDNVPF